MKISEFKMNKKLIFTNGEAKIEKSNLDDKVVEFKQLDFNLISELDTKVVSKMTGEESENEILYQILPYLTDIEMDISFDEFENMTKIPSKEFCQLLEVIIDEINLLIETSINITQLKKKNNTLNKKINKIIPTK